MSTIVTENNSNNNSNNGRWTPFREGLVFKEFIETWKEGDYEVDENLINKQCFLSALSNFSLC